MARPGVTYLEVKDSIALLQGKEKTITVDHIREELGTGSRTTINRHLKEWRNQQGTLKLKDPTLPQDLLNNIQGLWDKLREQANDKIQQHQVNCDEQYDQLQQENKTQKSELKKLREAFSQSQTQLEQQTEKAELLNTKFVVEQQTNHQLTERVKNFQERKQETEEENKKLHQQLEHSHNNLTHYQNMIGKQREQETLKLDSERQRIQHLETQLKNEITALTQTNANLCAQKNHFEEQLNKIAEQHSELAESQQTTQKELAQLQVKHEALQKQHQSLKKHHKGVEAALLTEKLKSEKFGSQLELQAQVLGEKEIKIQKLEGKLQKTEEILQNT